MLLTIQDTTDTDYTGKSSSEYLGSIPETVGTLKARLNSRLFNEKESYRWLAQFEHLQNSMADIPCVTVIDICDREADIQVLLQARRYDHVHYLVRSRGDRKVEGSDLKIRQALQNAIAL